MPKRKEDIYGMLAKKYSLHRDVITQICNHPFIFASRRISTPDDEKSFMFPYFGKIKLKRRYANKKKEKHDENSRKAMLIKESRKSI